MSPTRTVPIDRAAINRANSQHSTGPRTAAGKQRSSQNALRHGLTARTPVLTSEDQTAYENHHRQFENEHKPANVTESQLVKELADTSWRLNRIPLLEADILNRVQSPAPSPEPPAFDIVDAHRRQFQKALQQLRDLQHERQMREWNELKDAAAILELHKHEGLP
jgi:hypothetical protein